MDLQDAASELHAILNYLRKEKQINQKDLVALGPLVNPKTKESITLREEYISRAKQNVNEEYADILTSYLQKEFCITVEDVSTSPSDSKGNSSKGNFRIIIMDKEGFQKTCNKVINARNPESTIAIEDSKNSKFAHFKDTVWSLYTREGDYTSKPHGKGIGRHILRLKEGGQALIQNVTLHKDYKGKYRLDNTGHYLILEMSHSTSKDKDLHIFIPIGRGDVPNFCLGMYMNTGELGIGVVASTLVLVREENDVDLAPVHYNWETLISDSAPIDDLIVKYLQDKQLNKISIPKRGINSRDELEEWFNEQQGKNGYHSFRMHYYVGEYYLFYNRNGAILEYSLTIKQQENKFYATLQHVSGRNKPDPIPSQGVANIYEKIIYIQLEHRDRFLRSHVQIQVGGVDIEQYECFAATISGMNNTEEDMVSFPAVVVRKAVLNNNDEGEAKRLLLLAKLEKWKNNFLEISSPRRFLIENL